MSEADKNVNSIRNILVVDDEENARIGLSQLLSAEGYEVASAGNGLEALDCLRDDSFQLVITDLNMPRMGGLDFLQEVNRHHPDTNVIMMTAFGGIETYMEAMNLGVYEYLHKPIKLDELKSVMQKLSLSADGIA